MKKGYLTGIIIVIAVVVVGGGIYFYKTSSKNLNAITPQSTTNLSNTNTSTTKTTFTNQEQKNYYKLSQNAGDIGTPSASMTTNLDQAKVINGVSYYKTYSYDTRAAFGNDTSIPTNNNYSHLINTKVISLTGQTIPTNQFGKIGVSNLSTEQIKTQIAKIAALYIEGYTANNPKLEPNANNNYESNLNESPNIEVNLNNIQNINNKTLYNVNITINNKVIPIYVGLDGYIYISNSNYFNELFFPNKAN